MKLRVIFPALVAAALSSIVLPSPAQNSTPPGYLDRVRQYRFDSGRGENVNQGVSRSISTFWNIVNTNDVIVTPVYETATFGTTVPAPYMEIANNGTGVLTVVTTRATTIRSMTVTVDYEAQYPDGIPSMAVGAITTTFSLSKDAGAPVILLAYPASRIAMPAWIPNLEVVPTFDVASVNDSMEPFLTDLLAPNPTAFSVQPQTIGVFSGFTNASCAGTWILKVNNTTGAAAPSTFFLRGVTINVVGDINGFTVSGGSVTGEKDLTPRIISEQQPYQLNPDGTRTYVFPRYLSEQ